MPADERIRFCIPQSVAPREHSAQSCHHPARGIIGPASFHLPFSANCFRRKRFSAASARRDRSTNTTRRPKSTKHHCRSQDAMPQSDEQNQGRGHEGSGSHVTERYKLLLPAAGLVFADDNLKVDPSWDSLRSDAGFMICLRVCDWIRVFRSANRLDVLQETRERGRVRQSRSISGGPCASGPLGSSAIALVSLDLSPFGVAEVRPQNGDCQNSAVYSPFHASRICLRKTSVILRV